MPPYGSKKICGARQLTTKYINIKVNGNSRQSENTRLAGIRCRLNQEIQFLYKKKHNSE
jgi:hypothetical protein